MSALKPFSTKDILLYLAGEIFGVQKPLSPMVAEITLASAKFGQQNKAWGDLLDTNKFIEIPVQDLLDKLQMATTPLAKASFTTLSAEAAPMLQRSGELAYTAENIRKTDQEKQSEAMTILKSAWLAKTSPEKDLLGDVKKAETICNASAAELEKQTRARNILNSQLDEFAYRIYLALPNKNDVPPSAFTPAMRQRLGNSGG